jgi:hypothetical protein
VARIQKGLGQLAANQARSARDKHTLGHGISAPAVGLTASAITGKPILDNLTVASLCTESIFKRGGLRRQATRDMS